MRPAVYISVSVSAARGMLNETSSIYLRISVGCSGDAE